MSTLTEMIIVYALVAAAFLYVARGWIMKFLFKKKRRAKQAAAHAKAAPARHAKRMNSLTKNHLTPFCLDFAANASKSGGHRVQTLLRNRLTAIDTDTIGPLGNPA